MDKGFLELYAPLRNYVEQDDVMEVRANRECEIIIDWQDGSKERIKNDIFTYQYWRQLGRVLSNINRQSFDLDFNDTISTSLPNNHRIEFILNPVEVVEQIAITIRKYKEGFLTLGDFGVTGSIADEIINNIKKGSNIIISGGTGTGKTTLLKSMINYLSYDTRLITIEDACELPLNEFWDKVGFRLPRHSNKIDEIYIKRIKNMIRLNGDYIIMGEACSDNSLPILTALNSGESGFLTTIHADKSKLIINKMSDYIAATGTINNNLESTLSGCVDMLLQLEAYNNKGLIVEVYFPKEDRLELINHTAEIKVAS